VVEVARRRGVEAEWSGEPPSEEGEEEREGLRRRQDVGVEGRHNRRGPGMVEDEGAMVSEDCEICMGAEYPFTRR